jgi:hypothetical protein
VLSDFFYHKTIRRATAVFGTLFNNITIKNTHSQTGAVLRETKVPIAYGPKSKWLERIKTANDLDDAEKVAIQLPRLGFYITSLTYSPETATSMLQRPAHKVNNVDSALSRSASRSYNSTPYQISMQLSIISNRQDELFQIIEQIVPYFRPTFYVTVKQTDDYTATWDMPITLTSTVPIDSFESDFLTRREIVWDLDFEILVRFYGPISETGVIHKATANIRDPDETNYFYDKIEIEAIPDSPSETGYIITESHTEDFLLDD